MVIWGQDLAYRLGAVVLDLLIQNPRYAAIVLLTHSLVHMSAAGVLVFLVQDSDPRYAAMAYTLVVVVL